MTRRIPNPTHPSGENHWTRRMPERVVRGTAAAGAKLRDEDIDLICAFWRNGWHNKSAIGWHFGVSRITVWRHLKARGLIDRESRET